MTALLRLFNECNQRCVFCSYPADENRVPAAEKNISAWIKAAARLRGPLAQISGGEPFLARPDDLLKLAAYCARSGRSVEIQTNASCALENRTPAELRALVKAISPGGCFNVNFSADSPALDRKITRTRGAFARRLRAVRALLALGAAVRLTFVITKMNCARLDKFAALAAKKMKGVSMVQFSFVKAAGRAARDEKIVPRYAEAAPYLARALAVCRAEGLKCSVDHIPPCFLGVHRGCHVDVEKMKRRAKGPHLAEKARLKECRPCGLCGICAGPRKDYIAIYGGLK